MPDDLINSGMLAAGNGFLLAGNGFAQDGMSGLTAEDFSSAGGLIAQN
nr:hypothetical protein [Rahnella aquatilis]